MGTVTVVTDATVETLERDAARYQPFRVTVEDWRERNNDRPAGTWTFTVQAVDVPGAVQAAKKHLARRTTDRIVAVVADNGGR